LTGDFASRKSLRDSPQGHFAGKKSLRDGLTGDFAGTILIIASRKA
jgi:hypothetical protein